MKYNEKIKALREDNDLTQEEMGKILNVNQITVSQYERGTRQISIDILIKYAKHFNVSTDYIVDLTDVQKPIWGNKNSIIINGGKNKIEMK